MASSSLDTLLMALQAIQQDGLGDRVKIFGNYHHLHPLHLKEAMYGVMCELKTSMAHLIQPNQRAAIKQGETYAQEAQQIRLDNMLASEGITSSAENENDKDTSPSPSPASTQLSQLRQLYHDELYVCERTSYETSKEVCEMLNQHNQYRPVAQQDIEAMMAGLNRQYAEIRTLLKQSICQSALMLKSRMQEGRKKRRNFPKETVDILNNYFFSHLDNQYPNDEIKAELADLCGMTIYQVSNWFGNKRIRFKKGNAKAQQEVLKYAHEIQQGRMAAAASAREHQVQQYGGV